MESGRYVGHTVVSLCVYVYVCGGSPVSGKADEQGQGRQSLSQQPGVLNQLPPPTHTLGVSVSSLSVDLSIDPAAAQAEQ